MKKRVYIITLMLAMMFTCAACSKKDPSAGMTTETPTQSAEITTEESTEEPAEEPTEEETKEAGSSMRLQDFDGSKEGDALAKFGRTKFDSTFAKIGSVRRISYIYVGDGAEIYYGGRFCGWFAAWDFSEMGEMKETKTVSHSELETYVTHLFANGQEAELVERTTVSDGVLRYEFKLNRLTDEEDAQWLLEKKLAISSTVATERCTYPVSVYVYMTKESYCGYILYLEQSVLNHSAAEDIAEAVTFAKDSFTTERLVPILEKGIQEAYAEVEFQLPHQAELQEIKTWFADYNGEKLQRIAGTKDDNYSPSTCPDIVFYQVDSAANMESALAAMFKAIMDPLTVKSDVRSFTVTKYALGEQKMEPYEGRENVWILPYLNGYYAYEGNDLVSMDVAKQDTDDMMDGMVPFIRQGGNGMFQFILVKEGNVYRLQRAMDMGVVTDKADWK